MSITSIRQVNNNTPAKVMVVSSESGAATSLTPSGTPNAVAGTNIWIPWCTSQKDHDTWHHFIWIHTFDAATGARFGPEFEIWQKDDQVCFSTDGQWHSDAPATRPNAATGGDRQLVIRGDARGISAIEIHAQW